MAKDTVCGMNVRLLLIAMALLFPGIAFADYEGGMGRGMMGYGYGHPMGGWWFFGFGLYALLCLAGVIIFFWLMFRITWALEAMAKAKGEGKA